jgi:uncharacterized membrane protein
VDDGHLHPANQAIHDGATFGQRVADKVTRAFGSWRYLIFQTAVVAAWIALNLVGFIARWDPYPFILLNLVFSTQASYAAPLILLSQNRQSEHDRLRAEADFQINEQALTLLQKIHDGEIRLCRVNAEPHTPYGGPPWDPTTPPASTP